MLEKNSQEIRDMFGSIAHRYDLLNRLLSLSVDRYWRRLTVREVARFLSPDSLILDLCTGTGDLALGLGHRARVIGCDFCHPMLVLAAKKAVRNNATARICFVEGDALCLPFPSAHFHAVTIAFGLRNLENYGRGLEEIFRVLRAGGVLAVLEFSRPRLPLVRQLYLFYFTHLLPKLGKWISGREGPYSYLPASVKEFPDRERLDQLIEESGFGDVRHYPLTAGIAALHIAQKGV